MNMYSDYLILRRYTYSQVSFMYLRNQPDYMSSESDHQIIPHDSSYSPLLSEETRKKQENILAIMGGIMLGLFLAALDGTIISTSMPTIARQLMGMEFYVWPFTVYMLASTISIVIFGKLSDHYGRKLIFLVGILIFLVGSVLSGFSPDMILLILFRGIQGIGGGILMTLSFIMVAEIFPIWQRGKYMGILASVFGISSIIGPVLGGFITESIGWPWTFFLNIPIGLLSFFMIWHWYPDIAPVALSRRIDYMGIIIFIAAMIPLFLGFSLAGTVYSWVSPEILGMLGVSLILFVLFIRVQMFAAEPIIAIRLFKNQVFSISMVAVFLANSLFFRSNHLSSPFYAGCFKNECNCCRDDYYSDGSLHGAFCDYYRSDDITEQEV